MQGPHANRIHDPQGVRLLDHPEAQGPLLPCLLTTFPNLIYSPSLYSLCTSLDCY